MAELTPFIELIKQIGLPGAFFVYLLWRFDKAISIEAKLDKVIELLGGPANMMAISARQQQLIDNQEKIVERLDDIKSKLGKLP
jgi:hypothetical protein